MESYLDVVKRKVTVIEKKEVSVPDLFTVSEAGEG